MFLGLELEVHVCLGLSTNYNSSKLEADWGICMLSSCKHSSAENPKGPPAIQVYSNSFFFISLVVCMSFYISA